MMHQKDLFRTAGWKEQKNMAVKRGQQLCNRSLTAFWVNLSLDDISLDF